MQDTPTLSLPIPELLTIPDYKRAEDLVEISIYEVAVIGNYLASIKTLPFDQVESTNLKILKGAYTNMYKRFTFKDGLITSSQRHINALKAQLDTAIAEIEHLKQELELSKEL